MSGSYDDVRPGPLPPPPAPIIPYSPIVPPSSSTYVPAATFAAVYTEPTIRQTPISGVGELLPIVYGNDRVAARITAAIDYNGNLILRCEWCQGPISAINAVYVDNVATASPVTWTHYTGTQTTPDAMLVTAYAAKGVTYSDTLNGVAYSVGVFPPGTSQGFPRPVADTNGLLVAQSSGGTPTYSDNPVWLIAWIITQRLSASIDWTLFSAAAATCDALVSGEKKITVGLTLDTEQDVSTWLDVLRGYAACYITYDNGLYGLIPDAVASSVGTITEADMRDGDIRVESRNLRKTPNKVRIAYTDTTTTPWREAYAEASTGAGDIVSEVKMPYIHRYSQANRVAIERLNEFQLNYVGISFVTKDTGLKWQQGDVVVVTHSVGFSSALFRFSEPPVMVEDGRWQIKMQAYSASKYSSVVASPPTYVDTGLSSPLSPPSVTNLAVAEVSSAAASGAFTTQLQITWTGVTYAFLRDYRVMIYDESTLVQDGSTATTGFTSQPVAIGHNYRVVVFVRSSVAQGTGKQVAYTVNGSTAASPGEMLWASYQITPGASYTATAYQRGIGDVQKHNHVIGCTRGSARYQTLTEITSSAGNVGSWAALDSYAYVILFGDPPGIPGVDYIPGQPVAATVWDSASVSLFGGGHRACRLAVSLDVRQIAASGGNYQVGMTYAPYVGGVLQSSRTTFGTALSVDAASVVVKVATATAGQTNEAVLAAEVTTPGTLYVYTPTTTETQTVTSSASGALTITCTNNFAKLKGLPIVTAQTTSPRYPVVSNITYGSACTFDLRVYDENGALTATTCTIAIEGTV